MESYYEVVADDKCFSDRWFLGEPLSDSGEAIDARLFRYGRHYSGTKPTCVPITKAGAPVAFTLGAFDYPIVNRAAKSAIEAIALKEVALFPISVGGLPQPYWIVNVANTLDCVDEDRSVFLKWTASDHRPDRIGAYRSIRELRIHVGGVRTHMFRVKGWEVALVVSNQVRLALTEIPDLGVAFTSVS